LAWAARPLRRGSSDPVPAARGRLVPSFLGRLGAALPLRCGRDHEWEGCTCGRCRTTRNSGHQWNARTCSKCGLEAAATRDYSDKKFRESGLRLHQEVERWCPRCRAVTPFLLVQTAREANWSWYAEKCSVCDTSLKYCPACGTKRNYWTFDEDFSGETYEVCVQCKTELDRYK
jgi:hypothetical protein